MNAKPCRTESVKRVKLIYFLQSFHPLFFDLWEWLASNFSLKYHPWIKHYGHENKRNDLQLKKLVIFKQILLVSTFGNVKRTVWRICILMLGCKRLKASSWDRFLHQEVRKSIAISPSEWDPSQSQVTHQYFNRFLWQFTCTHIYYWREAQQE